MRRGPIDCLILLRVRCSGSIGLPGESEIHGTEVQPAACAARQPRCAYKALGISCSDTALEVRVWATLLFTVS